MNPFRSSRSTEHIIPGLQKLKCQIRWRSRPSLESASMFYVLGTGHSSPITGHTGTVWGWELTLAQLYIPPSNVSNEMLPYPVHAYHYDMLLHALSHDNSSRLCLQLQFTGGVPSCTWWIAGGLPFV